VNYRSYSAAVGLFLRELVELFGAAAPLVLLGLWRRRRSMVRPVDRFCQLFTVLYVMAVIQFASVTGYLEARHLLPLAIVALGAAAPGVEQAASLWSRLLRLTTAYRSRLALAIAAVSLAACTLRLAEPLHPTRMGHRLAGQWLADRTDEGLVLDSRGWSELYSGHPTWGYDRARQAFADRRLAYVVVERDELGLDTARSQTLGRLLDVAGQPAAEFAPADDKYRERASVVVYRWYPERFAKWLARHHDAARGALRLSNPRG
jgi:hypothetical protein